ncbi:ABC transporter permease [Candidatus Chloroploca sp. M-50]|uniref:ABC transporter permease n=1 Tax=Candidatus Chloroploca mongolica TaxID=2528176 RepID=A0ABS4DB04_9CHLR|nr:ABC transporter permease [Candidatus Chloroploca mongolica]MBP1466620.1 ABC transporter permease [Candidatus Chloroploca mongolica]
MTYLVQNWRSVGSLVVEHLWLTLSALAIALVIAVPTSILLVRIPRLRGPVLGLLGVLYTIPSLSLLVLLIPLLGLGYWPAVVTLVIYAQLVLVRNLVVGLTEIDAAILEAANGMGMNGWQRLIIVEFPLALPLLLAGLRIATLSTIGIATIAAFINAGGLGMLLFDGVRSSNQEKIVAGAIAVSLLAFGANALLRQVERWSRRGLDA